MAAAPDRIQIPGYDHFLDNLYGDWININCDFSNAAYRANCCASIIKFLVSHARRPDAQEIFNECGRLRVWNSNIGIVHDIDSVCQISLEQAQHALQNL